MSFLLPSWPVSNCASPPRSSWSARAAARACLDGGPRDLDMRAGALLSPTPTFPARAAVIPLRQLTSTVASPEATARERQLAARAARSDARVDDLHRELKMRDLRIERAELLSRSRVRTSPTHERVRMPSATEQPHAKRESLT